MNKYFSALVVGSRTFDAAHIRTTLHEKSHGADVSTFCCSMECRPTILIDTRRDVNSAKQCTREQEDIDRHAETYDVHH
jgi:hypothetical protein